MSRVAKNPINIPDNVDLSVNDDVVKVKGSKGELEFELPASISLDIKENVITVKYDESNQKSIALGGTTRSLVNNMIIGVSEGYEKKLELIGVGYRAKASGKLLELTLGFSHPVKYQLPDSVDVETPSQTEVVLKSYNKQTLGQVAAEIRAFRPPEPYKGKGVRYSDEHVKRKEAKKAAGAGLSTKNITRLRRAKKTRAMIKNQDSPRLTVFRSSRHFYAQVFDNQGSKVIVSASTNEKDSKIKSNNLEAAVEVGKKVAERALENGVKKVVFDRAGYKYHGRIKALADSARNAGLEF